MVVVAKKRSVAQWSAQLPACRVVAGPLSSKVLVEYLTSADPQEAPTTV